MGHDAITFDGNSIDDEWINDIDVLGAEMDNCMSRRKAAQSAFELRYGGSVDPEANRWERCENVLSRRDFVEKMTEA